MKKIKYAAILVILLILGNFFRLFIEEKNIPKVEINEEIVYQKDEAKKENDLSKTTEKFDANNVTFEELLKLGFTKSKATKIIEFQDEMGIIENLEEFGNIPRFGKSGLSQARKYLFVDREKIKNPTINYKGKNFKKYNINTLDEKKLQILGFTKKEIKGINEVLKNDKIYSNIDLEKIIGGKRYKEMEKRIKFIDWKNKIKFLLTYGLKSIKIVRWSENISPSGEIGRRSGLKIRR